jgi:hypothetical protein
VNPIRANPGGVSEYPAGASANSEQSDHQESRDKHQVKERSGSSSGDEDLEGMCDAQCSPGLSGEEASTING